MPKFSSVWDVTPETAHPRARELIGESIIWDFGDDDSPLGNDTGADTFADYLDFRESKPRGRVEEFVEGQLGSMEISDRNWELLESLELEESLKSDGGYELLRRDDFIIGLAFAQLLLEGGLDALVKEHAILALRRQAQDVVLQFRGGGNEEGRKQQLAEFGRILELA